MMERSRIVSMQAVLENTKRNEANDALRRQRAWARIAGLMYLVVLVVDLTGMQLHSPALSHSLMLSGSLFTVILALGLYYAVKPVQPMVAAFALTFRLLEAALGTVSTVTGFQNVQSTLAGSNVGTSLLNLAQWDRATSFSALVFTIGSTLFFILFVKSGYIPRVLAWFGLCASVIASAACSTHLVNPAFPAMATYPWIPMLLAEISTGLWLMIKSVQVTRPAG